MFNDYWSDENVLVEMKKTAKTITITPISQKPIFTHGCIDDLWRKGKIVIREPKANKVSPHTLREWGDGRYTLYPYRAGIPFVLQPAEVKNAH